MTNVANITAANAVTGTVAHPAASASAGSSSAVSAPSAVAPATGGAAKPLSATSNYDGFSTRLIIDPTVGVITEYLNNSGQVQSQVPSATVVAYLRQGLTADGSEPSTTGALA